MNGPSKIAVVARHGKELAKLKWKKPFNKSYSIIHPMGSVGSVEFLIHVSIFLFPSLVFLGTPRSKKYKN